MFHEITFTRRIFLYWVGIFVCGFFAVAFLVHGISVMLYIPKLFPNLRPINCTDTTCLLRVFGDKCYAKFEFYPDAKYELVKCNIISLEGIYNTTIPCDVSDDNKPIISCEHRVMSRRAYIGLLLCLVIFQLLCGFCFMGLASVVSEKCDKYVKSFVLNGDKKDPPPEDTKIVELDDV